VTAGILNVNKPCGMTSFAVVTRVRRLTGVRRVGHAGTLDPVAEGVLPICIGPATRIVEYLVSAPKVYHATIRLGASTDTYDSEGTVTATGDASRITREVIERELATFVGEIEQIPPLYSALKYEGRPLYEYARAGKDVPRLPRTVHVYRLQLLRFDPPRAEVTMEVGRGAYVRTLAQDIGERLGCHAHLESLTRLRSGPFVIEDAVDLDTVRRAAETGTLNDLLSAPDRVLEHWHAAILDEQHARVVSQGTTLMLESPGSEARELPPEAPCRAYSSEGAFLAILRHRGSGRWHPEKVFGSAE
jgi:tRNA pseudouridine55 synthase